MSDMTDEALGLELMEARNMIAARPQTISSEQIWTFVAKRARELLAKPAATREEIPEAARIAARDVLNEFMREATRNGQTVRLLGDALVERALLTALSHFGTPDNVAAEAAAAIRTSDAEAGMVLVPRKKLTEISHLINEQAEDDMLWFQAVTITEAHLQQKLRQLTALVEAMIAAHEESRDG